MNKDLTICLLLSPSDEKFIKGWCENHDGIASRICVGIDEDGPKAHNLYTKLLSLIQKSQFFSFNLNLNNDFAGAKNQILDRCETKCRMFIDADELLMPHTADHLKTFDWEYDVVNPEGSYAGVLRYNLFNRHFVHPDNYHMCFLNDDTRFVNTSPYLNASPGCHEVPNGFRAGILNPDKYQILHLKENWTGNFRAKGYFDSRQQDAIDALEKEIEATK